MGLSFLYLNFLSSTMIDFNSFRPFLDISAFLVFNRESILFSSGSYNSLSIILVFEYILKE